MTRGRRLPPRSPRRTDLPPPVPVVSPAPSRTDPQPKKAKPVRAEPASETDQTEEQIRRMLEAAYT
ncbi:MAG: hypothetical protein AB7F35_23260 [Acetobacteraceae bacterium]